MSEFSYHSERIASTLIAERVQNRQRSATPGRRRRTGRHSIAAGLHSLADRLDT